jgi:hypothetical protein
MDRGLFKLRFETSLSASAIIATGFPVGCRESSNWPLNVSRTGHGLGERGHAAVLRFHCVLQLIGLDFDHIERFCSSRHWFDILSKKAAS